MSKASVQARQGDMSSPSNPDDHHAVAGRTATPQRQAARSLSTPLPACCNISWRNMSLLRDV